MSKLVRDKIPEIMIVKNKNPKIKIITNDLEYFSFLTKKLLEEVDEFIEASNKSEKHFAEEEMADVLEVIEAICKFKNYDDLAIQKYKLNKKYERGGFEKRIILE